MNPMDVVVIIATRQGREELLLNRALPSVWRQTRPPRAVVVVDDDRRDVIRWGHQSIVPTPNRRVQRMSGTGCWNTAIYEAQALLPYGGYLAFLDDDDAWLPGYLEACEAELARHSRHHVAMVASGLVYIDDEGRHRRMPPADLSREHFLERRPAIHTSNLFVSLEAVVTVGGFDEALRSQTDRDFCIRLIDRAREEGWRVAHINDALVEYYAHGGGRVTTDANAQRLGMATFSARHRVAE